MNDSSPDQDPVENPHPGDHPMHPTTSNCASWFSLSSTTLPVSVLVAAMLLASACASQATKSSTSSRTGTEAGSTVGAPEEDTSADPVVTDGSCTQGDACEPEFLDDETEETDDETEETDDETEETGSEIDEGDEGIEETDDETEVIEDADSDGVPASLDCDDLDDSRYPGAEEACDGIDNDCDGEIDEDIEDIPVWFLDADMDAYPDPDVWVASCTQPEGYIRSIGEWDCDDIDDTVHPAADELCDEIDHNCDGDTTLGAVDTTPFFADTDGDGFGNPTDAANACTAPDGFVAKSDDCDDTDGTSYPGAIEVCDRADNDCDDIIDNDEQVLGDAADCAAIDCLDVIDHREDAEDGHYVIDPDGTDPFDVFCEMTTDGGGWTLVASFTDHDGDYNWVQFGTGTNNLVNWRNEDTFGSLDEFDLADFKSKAYSRVDATDLLALDSGGGWASYGAALSGTLYDTITATTTCSTSPLAGVTVDSSDVNVADFGTIAFYGSDPNGATGRIDFSTQACALYNYNAGATNNTGIDSAVVALGGFQYSSDGFGRSGFRDPSGIHTDQDEMFCLTGASTEVTTSWYGHTTVTNIDSGLCDYSLLLVR